MTLDVEPSPETHALYEAIRMFRPRGAGRAAAPSRLCPAPEAAEGSGAARRRARGCASACCRSWRRARPHDESLAFSLSQEIAAALARFRWFDVIAPVTLMRRPTAPRRYDDPLRPDELDYVVDGALSSDGEKYQISVRLLDLTRYATPVWSDRFELARSTSCTSVDEMVTARIVGRIDPVILFIEGQPKRRENHGATGLLLRAIPMIYSMEREKFEEAGRLIKRALEIDPNDAMALAWAAYWDMSHVGQGWTARSGRRRWATAEELCAARDEARSGQCRGARHLRAHSAHGRRISTPRCTISTGRCGSIRTSPIIWALSAATYCYIGEPEDGAQAARALSRARAVRSLFRFLRDDATPSRYCSRATTSRRSPSGAASSRPIRSSSTATSR